MLKDEYLITIPHEEDREYLQYLVKLYSRLLHKKDPYLWIHSVNVASYAYAIADSLKLIDDQKFIITIGAMLHDVGKLEIPDSILKKEDKLLYEEWNIMKQHSMLGYETLLPLIEKNKTILDIVLYHHETLDGKGYPYQLTDDDISLPVRIVSLADSYDAMTSNRVYQRAKDKKSATYELLINAGTQFDKNLTHMFVDILNSGKPTPEVPYFDHYSLIMSS